MHQMPQHIMQNRRPGDIIPQSSIHPVVPTNAVQPLQAPTRYLTVPGIPQLAPGATSPGSRLEFSGGAGWVIGWNATAADLAGGAADRFQQFLAGVRITINGEEELGTNGQGGAFIRFADLFKENVQWSPIMRYMLATDVVLLQIQNFSAAVTLDTSVTFAFIRDGDYPGT